MAVIKVKLSEWWPYIQEPFDDKWGYIWGTSGVMWTQARQKDLVQKYNSDPEKYADYKMGATYGKKWIGHYVIDCSGMPRRAFKKLGVEIAHGSNSIWKNYLSERGKLNDKSEGFLSALPKGAAIFTGTDSSKPHIGTYDGKGYVIEAQGTLAGVVKTPITDKKWTYWGLYKNLDYEGTEINSPIETPNEPVVTTPSNNKTKPTLRRGDKGEYVTLLQTKLLNLKYSLPKFGADGDFGKETESAVKQFQTDHGLTADGVVGPKTWKELDSDKEIAPKKLYTVTIQHLSQSEAEAVLKQYPGQMTQE